MQKLPQILMIEFIRLSASNIIVGLKYIATAKTIIEMINKIILKTSVFRFELIFV